MQYTFDSAPTNGRDLQIARQTLEIRQTQLAATWGITHQRISSLESAPRLGPFVVGHYIAGLLKIAER